MVAFTAVPAMAQGNGNHNGNNNNHHGLNQGNKDNDDFLSLNDHGGFLTDNVHFRGMNDTLLIGEDFFPSFFVVDE